MSKRISKNLLLDIINQAALDSSSESNSLKLTVCGTYVPLSNFNLAIKRKIDKKLDTKGSVTKLLDSKLVPGLSDIINSYRKPYMLDELMEQWRKEDFPSTNFKLDSTLKSMEIISEFNYIQWQYYFDVSKVVYYGKTGIGSSIYTIKAGTKLFSPLKDVEDLKLSKIGNDFFFSPEMAEFSIIRYFKSYKEGDDKYKNYYIVEFTTNKDINLIFNAGFEVKTLDRSFYDLDGFLALGKFVTPAMNQPGIGKLINESRDYKIRILKMDRLETRDNYSQVYMPNLIISKPADSLSLENYYQVNSKNLVNKYLIELNKIIINRSNTKPSGYNKERVAFGPMKKPINKDYLPIYPTLRIKVEIDRLIKYILGDVHSFEMYFEKYYEKYPGVDVSFQYIIPKQELITLLNEIKADL